MKTIIVLFDVDETLIKIKSMFSFYEFLQYKISVDSLVTKIKCENFFDHLKKMSDFCKREEINKFYYSKFFGLTEEVVIECALEWWKQINNSELFHNQVMKKFNDFNKKNVKTILVSGSLRHCLEPLKKFLSADYLIATDLITIDGVLTGEIVGEPTIGIQKAKSVLNLIHHENLVVDFENSYAYGDHESDKPMLRLVGNPYLVIDGHPHQLKRSNF